MELSSIIPIPEKDPKQFTLTVTLTEKDVEIVRLDYGLRLYVIKKLNKPILFASAEGTDPQEIVEVVRFYRSWISRLFRTRRCSGVIKMRKVGSEDTPRLLYFINAHPFLGYRLSWDNDEGLSGNTDWVRISSCETLHRPG